MKLKFIATILFFITLIFSASAQDLDALLDEETDEITDYSIATFLNSRIINGHSVEQMPKNGLDFRIAHRFGTFNEGGKEFYGLDESNSYFVLDYGITDRIMVGVGRATLNKLATGYLKFKIFRQSSGAVNFPMSISFLTSASATTKTYSDEVRNDDFISRLEYTYLLLLARKMNKVSVQLSPTFVHRNLVDTKEDLNNIAALGIGGRYKITSKWAVNAEYFYVNHSSLDKYYNPLSFAVSYQVSHHVFQILLTNSMPITANSFIGNTTHSWTNGDLRLGFNISTVF
jgi:opacity protein-like surface antigen